MTNSDCMAPTEWLEDVFDACAEVMNAWDGDEPLTPADALASFEDAAGVELTESERAHLSARLAHVATAIQAFGPAL